MSRQQERYRQIAQALSRHGMGYLVGVLGLERWVPFQHGMLGHQPREEPYTRPEHLRLALEELGATFVKLEDPLDQARSPAAGLPARAWQGSRTPPRRCWRTPSGPP